MGKLPGNSHMEMDLLSTREWRVTPNVFAKKRETTGCNEGPPGQGILYLAFVVHLGLSGPGDGQCKRTEKSFPLKFKKKVSAVLGW